LLLTVPAHKNLWSYFDEASGHCRRYSREQLESTLVECGFRVEFMTEFMMALCPILWLARRLTAWMRKPDSAPADSLPDLWVVPVLNQLLLPLL